MKTSESFAEFFSAHPLRALFAVVFLTLAVLLLPLSRLLSLFLSPPAAALLSGAGLRILLTFLALFTAKKAGLPFPLKSFKPTLFFWASLSVAVVNLNPAAFLLGDATLFFHPVYTPLYFLYVSSVALAEESVFRGLVLPLTFSLVRGKNKTLKAVLLSAGIFGLFHAVNLLGGDVLGTFLQIGYTTLLGALFAVLTVSYESLLPAVLLHAFFDVGGVAFSSFSGYALAKGNVFNLIFILTTLISGVFVGILTLKKVLDLNKSSPPNEPTLKNEK